MCTMKRKIQKCLNTSKQKLNPPTPFLDPPPPLPPPRALGSGTELNT